MSENAVAVDEISDLLARNRAWAQARVRDDADAFLRQRGQQAPPYLWIGCADSRVPPDAVIGLGPGELFVHRNIANLAQPQDASFLAVLQYAVQVLKVRHVLVVGHYGCGGVGAALNDLKLGLIDQWLAPIRALAQAHRAELDALPDDGARQDRLSELNVLAQVQNVADTAFVREAWAATQPLTLHGWCYSLATGLITDLKADVSGP